MADTHSLQSYSCAVRTCVELGRKLIALRKEYLSEISIFPMKGYSQKEILFSDDLFCGTRTCSVYPTAHVQPSQLDEEFSVVFG